MARTKSTMKSKASPRRARIASHKTKSSSKSASGTSRKAGETPVSIDRRRGSRRGEDKHAAAAVPAAPPVKLERRQKVNRRRQIDPTTCERDYTNDEVEFMNALDEYKRKSGRMFPTCSEVLEVVRSLGYVRLSPSDTTAKNSHGTGTAVQVMAVTAVVEAEDFTSQRDWQ